jgi:hypothetical protein
MEEKILVPVMTNQIMEKIGRKIKTIRDINGNKSKISMKVNPFAN